VLPAALVNFGVGTATPAVAAVVEIEVREGWSLPMPGNAVVVRRWPLGVLAVGISAAIVRITGVLPAVGAVAGQLVGGLLLDFLLPADLVRSPSPPSPVPP
jgi:uncharacterized membrane protein YdcZ (DUF606 family)